MAKKKKRRLKKSVKRGCGTIILLLVLGIVFMVHRCTNNENDNENENCNEEWVDRMTRELTESERMEVRETWEKLEPTIYQPARLDTALIAVSIYDITLDAPVVQWHDKRMMPPASCMKLLTAITALQRLGMDHTYEERVAYHGRVHGGTLRGTLLIHADDDPEFTNLGELLDKVKAKGITQVEGEVVIDLLRTDTLRPHPTAATWDIPYHKVPLAMKGQKRMEREVAYLLAAKGIKVKQNEQYAYQPLQGLSPTDDPTLWRQAINELTTESKTIALQRTPITKVIRPMLIHSSNIRADALYWHMNHTGERTGQQDPDGRQMMQRFIDEDMRLPEEMQAGIVINDGSGLSPENRLSADFLVRLLLYAWDKEEIRKELLDHALATPGSAERRGSLTYRMAAPMFRGRIFCKTGTMTTIGASSLSGYAQGSNGHWYAFSIINEDSPVAESRIYQDKICKELVK